MSVALRIAPVTPGDLSAGPHPLPSAAAPSRADAAVAAAVPQRGLTAFGASAGHRLAFAFAGVALVWIAIALGLS